MNFKSIAATATVALATSIAGAPAEAYPRQQGYSISPYTGHVMEGTYSPPNHHEQYINRPYYSSPRIYNCNTKGGWGSYTTTCQ